MTYIKITGGKAHERQIGCKVVLWCMRKFDLKEDPVHIDIAIRVLKEDAGYCEELQEPVPVGKKGRINAKYLITVAQNQTLRDFVMTVIHEMVHVRQYITRSWEGDGEEEAWELQEIYADEIWSENIL